jgi:hypothetical protein
MLGCRVSASAYPHPPGGDLDGFARAAGEDDVITPAKYLCDRPARFFKQSAGTATLGVGRIGIGPDLETSVKRCASFGEQGRRRRMVKIDAIRRSQNAGFLPIAT